MSTMEATASQSVSSYNVDFHQEVAELGERARIALAERRSRLAELQQQITAHTRCLASELEQDRTRLNSEQAALTECRSELERQKLHLETLRNELSGDRSEWDSHQTRVIQRQEKLLTALAEQYERLELVREDFTVRESAFHEQEVRFEHEQTTFYSLQLQQAERDDQLDTASRELTKRENRLQESQTQLEAEEAALRKQLEDLATMRAAHEESRREVQALEERTRQQRKQLATQLRAQKRELLAEVEQRQNALQAASHTEELQLHTDAERLRGQLEAMQHQNQETRELLTRKEEELAQLQRAAQSHKEQSNSEIAYRKQIEELTRERKSLELQLQAANEKSGGATNQAVEPDDDLRHRYEAVTQELRELKQANRHLQEQLKAANSNSSGAGSTKVSNVAMDWEAQKRRLLAQLEDDDNEETFEQSEARLSIEETIRETDRIIAEKDEEIRELRQLLQEQSNNIGEVAVGASAIAAMLDSDELILEERENLKQIQVQWREKLRQAELDISVERAKVARDRTELEERMQAFERQRDKLEQELLAGTDDPEKKPNRRKWMDRLGIKSDS